MVSTQNKLTLTVDEAAECLGIGRSLAYEMVRQGKIPAIRLGGKWLISKAGLERMLECAGRKDS
jgi:excisionase family DNA binding protein